MQNIYIKELDKEVEAPDGWSYNAMRIFADKYLAIRDKNSIPLALRRVAHTVAVGDQELAEVLYDGMVRQKFAFNSPVFFNAGVEERPQCSACFIQRVDDNMDSILDLAVKEGKLFQYGSGTGTNLSRIRSKDEGLSNGGKPSGPVSFMRAYDAVAGIVKSGGKTRRAAKMQILDCDHPDIEEFIWCKASEEHKAKDLIEKAGYEASFDGEAYGSVFFQNANLSVRVTDTFMDAVDEDEPWPLTARTTGKVLRKVPARQIFRGMAEAAWACGDPGIQFHDMINHWNTCSHVEDIVASNPCSEYMFLNETSCNLASLNLVKYVDDDGNFLIEEFVDDVGHLAQAMDRIVDLAGYPTPEIGNRTRQFRTLGIGYTNLGHLLAIKGLAYDSEEARDYAASITALMHFAASYASAVMASKSGPYAAYDAEAHMRVHDLHMTYLRDSKSPIWVAAKRYAETARFVADKCGFRNAQVTVLAPTGTISFIMDCVTTGIEPLFARRMTKQLAGGGEMLLEFDDPHIRTADEVSPRDHVLMMAACQPFISGAISKTINMPSHATVEDVENIYHMAWSHGIKALAIYRDGCKLSQPLSAAEDRVQPVMSGAVRLALPDERPAITHKFHVGGHDGYLTVGLYEDGRPGELFVQVSKEGSTISGLLDSWAIMVSIGLQHGIPLETLMSKMEFTRFEPSGFTGNADIPMAHSIVDYIARWMLLRFELGATADTLTYDHDEKTCPDCGSMMQRTGACYSCSTCGRDGGCG
jgi:ribonucleoside-diphosphate reductase alpha chain